MSVTNKEILSFEQKHNFRSLMQVFSRMSKDEIREFWDKKRIIPNNWIELCAFLLKEEFSDDFTVPLLQTDNSFMLQV